MSRQYVYNVYTQLTPIAYICLIRLSLCSATTFFALSLLCPSSCNMAAVYDFSAWPADEVKLFDQHYNIAIAKADKQEAKLVSDFDILKNMLLKHGGAEVQTLPPHLVGIHEDNRDRKLMHAAEMSSKGAKIVGGRRISGPLRPRSCLVRARRPGPTIAQVDAAHSGSVG